MKVTQMSAFSTAPSLSAPVIQKNVAPSVKKTAHPVGNISKLLSEFDKDDYILLGLIVILVFEGCDDYILLASLGYLFFMGLK